MLLLAPESMRIFKLRLGIEMKGSLGLFEIEFRSKFVRLVRRGLENFHLLSDIRRFQRYIVPLM